MIKAVFAFVVILGMLWFCVLFFVNYNWGTVTSIQDATTWWVCWNTGGKEQVVLKGVVCFHEKLGTSDLSPLTVEQFLTFEAILAAERFAKDTQLRFEYVQGVVVPHLPNGVDAQEYLLSRGLVCLWTKRVPKEWIMAEKLAQEEKVGIWETDPPTMPNFRPYNSEDLPNY